MGYLNHALRPFILLVGLSAAAFLAQGQSLQNGRQSSYVTSVYRINTDVARKLSKQTWKVDTTYLADLVVQFPADSTYTPHDLGHYVFAKARGSSVNYSLVSINNLCIRLLTNHRDLVAVFVDSAGNERHDIRVFAGRRRISYDPAIQAYRLSKSNYDGLVEAEFHGHTSFFDVTRARNNPKIARMWKDFSSVFPINQVVSIFDYLISCVKAPFRGYGLRPPGIYYRIRNAFRPSWLTGYIVLNKPVFKPGDTVRVKAFVTNRKGKPYKKTLDATLGAGYDEDDHVLAKVSPYRKGAYQFYFILSDSLKLKLNKNYRLYLGSTGAAHVMQSFEYEEYELKQNRFDMTTRGGSPGKPPILVMKGTDSNGMPLFDVDATLVLHVRDVNELNVSPLFIPDTLWVHRKALEPVGETIIQLPDSIMPDATVDLIATGSFLNSANERVTRDVMFRHVKRELPARLSVSNDTLVLTRPSNQAFAVDLLQEGPLGNTTKRISSFPYRELIDPHARSYSIQYPGKPANLDDKLDLNLSSYDANVEILASRTSDSLFIVLNNPRRLVVRYFLFHNQKLVERGEAEQLRLQRSAHGSGSYSVSIQYTWGGQTATSDYQISYRARKLEIKVNTPPLVYPGQTVGVDIHVEDIKGNPVKDADLTAFAITRKFESRYPPSTPQFEKKTKSRRQINGFREDQTTHTSTTDINWNFWKDKLGLDTMVYYQLLNPTGGLFVERMPAPTCQFAPLVVRDGSLMDIEIIYLDGQPVYYADAMLGMPYAIPANPGFHTLQLRLPGHMITVNNFELRDKQKLIYCLDFRKLPSIDSRRRENTAAQVKQATVRTAPYLLTEDEIRTLTNYFVEVEVNHSTHYAFLRQGNRYYPLQNPFEGYGSSSKLVGPLYPGTVSYVALDSVHFSFDFQPRSRYAFKDNMVKVTPIDLKKQFKYWSYRGDRTPDFGALALTEDDIHSWWNDMDDQKPIGSFWPPEGQVPGPSGKLKITRLPDEVSRRNPIGIIAFNLDKPDDFSILRTYGSDHTLATGHYHIVYIYPLRKYLKIDSLFIQQGGTTYYDGSRLKLQPADEFSLKALKIMRKWATEQEFTAYQRRLELQRLREAYYQTNQAHYSGNKIFGRVTDEGGGGIPGVNVVVKGTVIGTVTDADGNYQLSCPPGSSLVFSFIGYGTQEAEIGNRAVVDMSMSEDVEQLSEVVITGGLLASYEYRKPSDAVLAKLLQGKIPGVTIRGYDNNIAIRGYATVNLADKPLFLLDGVPVSDSALDTDRIKSMTVLRGDQALALYGERGRNGVVLMSLKSGISADDLISMSRPQMTNALSQASSGSSLRRNFRDYAYWKPQLRTDEAGDAHFSATFPDDITGWDTHVLAMTENKMSGDEHGFIQSYKPLLAEVFPPHFLVEGDTAAVIGKITNYQREPIQISRVITINHHRIDSSSIDVRESAVDSLMVTTSSRDSTTIEYKIHNKDYVDGERRSIPHIKPGTMEVKGQFYAPAHDTVFRFDPDPDWGTVSLRVHAHPIDVLLDEVEFLKGYPYECNEQTASRLFGLLVEKRIKESRSEKFTEGPVVRKLVKKLMGNQNQDGSWGWWGSGAGRPWVTMHVARALALAVREGFEAPILMDDVSNYLTAHLQDATTQERLLMLLFLSDQGSPIAAEDEIAALKKKGKFSVFSQLLAERLLQQSGKTPNWKWLDSVRHETALGNYYWEDTDHDNAIECSLVAYRLMGGDNDHRKYLNRARNFFLEKRETHWQNTYLSARIVETLLPEMLKTKASQGKPQVKLAGSSTRTLEKFPVVTELPNNTPVTISTSGNSPLYLSLSQIQWNREPVRSVDGFSVTTRFENGQNNLLPGRLTTMLVTVEVMKSADHVMIEVPIPAGCSYGRKEQSHENGEVYREYGYQKTDIYCEHLAQGTYTYSIELVPRYTGSYTINPAVAQCMYLPLIKGQEGLKLVAIRKK